ncbi:MAG: IPExxxVDY family protein [Bacteroidales bacterium]|nr:IPExxxVDY family protein [Bacteroidales bacterium]
MRNTMKEKSRIRRVRLKNSGIHHWTLFGIVSSEPDYRLSLALNRKLEISLKSSSPQIIHDDKDAEMSFSKFSSSSGPGKMNCNLVSNRSGKSLLVRKMKSIDYFLLIHESLEEKESDLLLKSLRETECITAALKIEAGTLKGKDLKNIIHQI